MLSYGDIYFRVMSGFALTVNMPFCNKNVLGCVIAPTDATELCDGRGHVRMHCAEMCCSAMSYHVPYYTSL